MSRNLADARRWVEHGTKLFTEAVGVLDDHAFAVPSRLPEWTRKHLVAHVAANADAIGNLVHWAKTGEVTPMYSSPEQRNVDIEAGARLPVAELVAWSERSADSLHAAMEQLTDEQWSAQVLTAQGRTVPAGETPWMRAREVMVHAVDLGTRIAFADLPADFLGALCDDIVSKRSAAAGTRAAGPALRVRASELDRTWDVAGDGELAVVTGTLAAVAAYLSGRDNDEVTDDNGDLPPPLPAWL